MKRIGFFLVFSLLFSVTDIGFSQETKTGVVTGKLITKDGKPMSGGKVFFFNAETGPPPSPERYWRVPDEISDMDSEGRFSVVLVAGRYFMGAIKRVSGPEIGPPRDGDMFLASRDENGKPKQYMIRKGEKTDIGVISGATPFKRPQIKDGISAIEGTVIFQDGKPAEGALVFAYMTPTMTGRPTFVSEKAGRDGKYVLRVSEGGKYYLKVRDIYGGGPPTKGGIVGSYAGEAPIPVSVKTGETTRGIDIKVVRFRGRGPKGPVPGKP